MGFAGAVIHQLKTFIARDGVYVSLPMLCAAGDLLSPTQFEYRGWAMSPAKWMGKLGKIAFKGGLKLGQTANEGCSWMKALNKSHEALEKQVFSGLKFYTGVKMTDEQLAFVWQGQGMGAYSPELESKLPRTAKVFLGAQSKFKPSVPLFKYHIFVDCMLDTYQKDNFLMTSC